MGQELRLVHEHASQRVGPVRGTDALPQVGRSLEAVGFGVQPDPAGDGPGTICAPTAIVERRSPQHRRHPALAVVEIGLEQRGRFSRIHARVVEVEFGHQEAITTRIGLSGAAS